MSFVIGYFDAYSSTKNFHLEIVPLSLARFGGERALKFRWWGMTYLLLSFVAFPVVIFLISIASPLAASIIVVLFVVLGAFVAIINSIRDCKPGRLPGPLASWKWLPSWFRSLDPYDK